MTKARATDLGPAEAPLALQRPFRMLTLSRFESRVAQNALNFGLILLIVDATGKALFSSLLVLALVVPSTVVGLIAGSAADSMPKRALVVAGNLGRAAVCILFVLGPGSTATYYLVAIGLATAGQFAVAAEGAILPAIVARAQLTHANAITQAAGGAAQLIGLAVLTPLVLRVFHSPGVLFGSCAVLFTLAAIHALFIGSTRSRERREIGGDAAGPWWQAGWRQMRADPAVMHSAVELTLISAALIILSGLVPKYIEDTLGLPIDIGVLVLMPAAVGVIVGLRVATVLARRVPHSYLSTFGFMAFVVNLALVTFVNPEASFLSGFGIFSWLNRVNIGNFDQGSVLVMIFMLPLGFSFATVSVAAQTVINHRVPLHLQGRVLATQGAMAAIASSVPVVAAGALSDVLGVTPVMALVAFAIGTAAVANIRPLTATATQIRHAS